MTPHKLRHLLIGAPRDPLNPATRHSIALIAFFAWIGLGADGLSSSAYGPEIAYLALGKHTHLALYLALATALTVFVISLAYNQVIELFPTGGGGYKVASQLIGPHAGLVSGSALIVDYVLTITISVASGADALFSLLPLALHPYKVWAEMLIMAGLIVLNLRGMKEAIKVLLPVFIGFVITHAILIFYGIWAHAEFLPSLIPSTLEETRSLSSEIGVIGVVAALMLAYSQGGGTYTGLEAVSNNINTLAEPRVRTGKWTMFYLASSLAFTAAGILVLYLLWNVSVKEGETLNAVVFRAIIGHAGIESPWVNHALMFVVLAFEAGLLFVAANTGFLGGPAVLANMAVDSWVPRQFRQLSSRLVTQNGVLLMGIASVLILLWSGGNVNLLVVLYSINVFLTFSLSLLGLCIYWWTHRKSEARWRRRMLLSAVGLMVTASILAILLVEKFTEGGWVTILITGVVIGLCLFIKAHYNETRDQLQRIDELFPEAPMSAVAQAPELDKGKPTAIFLVGKNRGVGMHSLLWVQRLFPDHFKNFVFIAAGEVDVQSFSGNDALKDLQKKIHESLEYYVNFCQSHGMAATCYETYGCDPLDDLGAMVARIMSEYANSVCFASKLIFVHDNFLTRWLHNQTALAMQRRLHLQGLQMVILPMKV